MHALVRTIFSRLQTLDPAIEEAKLQMNEEDTQEGEIKLNVAATLSPIHPNALVESNDESLATPGTAADNIEKQEQIEKEEHTEEIAPQEVQTPTIPKPECTLSNVRIIKNCSSLCRWPSCNN